MVQWVVVQPLTPSVQRASQVATLAPRCLVFYMPGRYWRIDKVCFAQMLHGKSKPAGRCARELEKIVDLQLKPESSQPFEAWACSDGQGS